MAERLAKCQDCGKLFGARPGKLWCAACATERVEQSHRLEQALDELPTPTHDDLARHMGISTERVRRLITSIPSLSAESDSGPACLRCRKGPAQAGSDFCLNCRLELNQAFGKATDRLFAQFPVLEYEPQVPNADGGLGFVTSLREKRSRSGPRVEEIAPGRGLI